MTPAMNPSSIRRAIAAVEKLIRMRRVVLSLVIFATSASAQLKHETGALAEQVTDSTPKVLKPVHGRPAIISIKELSDFKILPAERKRLIEIAIAVATQSPWLPYLYGGADPALGGMDCSGAMYYVMNRAGLAPPRTAAAQYHWLDDHQRLHLVTEEADNAEHPSLRWLKPGDLLFWSSGNITVPGEIVIITHVAMYLGHETRDARKIMINSTDGRSYRGIKSNGYGIYDFKMPANGSKSKLIGYGTPPGIPESIMDHSAVPQAKEAKH
jgi:cell wall-associated NlpC family hydrolase